MVSSNIFRLWPIDILNFVIHISLYDFLYFVIKIFMGFVSGDWDCQVDYNDLARGLGASIKTSH